MTIAIPDQHLRAGQQFAIQGFEIVSGVLRIHQCGNLANELSNLQEDKSRSTKGKPGGLRNLLRKSPQIAELACSQAIKEILERRLGREFFPVRAIFFDKNPAANWFVTWHQDVTIAVAGKIETLGYEAWSVKEGVVHVQPPREVLESLVTLRLHLDDCTADNGALKIIPGSHLRGKLGSAEILDCINEHECVI